MVAIVLAQIIVLLFLSRSSSATGSCKRTNCFSNTGAIPSVKYGSYREVSDKVFHQFTPVQNFTVIGPKEEKEKACIGSCTELGIKKCLSGHILDTTTEGETTCSLFSQTKYALWHTQNNGYFNDRPGAMAFYVLNSFCESTHCSGSPCKPFYETDTGVCMCNGQSGRYCEIVDPLTRNDACHYVPNENNELENIGKGVSTYGHGNLVGGKIIRVPDRHGKVIQCDGKGVSDFDCLSAPDPISNFICLSNYEANPYCVGGFTYGFWFRILRDNEYDQQTRTLHIIRQADGPNVGVALLYSPTFYLNIELPDTKMRCSFTTDQLEKAFKQWSFVAFSYDHWAKNLNCFFDKTKITSSKLSASIATPASMPFRIGGAGSFLIADIFHFSYPSSDTMFQTLYETTKR